jgi:hypothetical protein
MRPTGFGLGRRFAGLEGCGPSQPRSAEFNPFHGADGADALQGIGHQWPIRFGAGLEGCGPSQPRSAKFNTISRRRRSGRPPTTSFVEGKVDPGTAMESRNARNAASVTDTLRLGALTDLR